MTITNETKIGALATVSIALMFLGFNFLKGKNVLEREKDLYAVFPKVDGLNRSDAVRINGFVVGKVAEIRETGPDLAGVVVSIQITKNILIPKDSYAIINANPLGSTVVNITKGSSSEYLHEGDTIRTVVAAGLLEDLKGSMAPTMDKVNGALTSLDSLVEITGSTLDPDTRKSLQQSIQNLEASTAALQVMLAAQSNLNKTLANVETLTASLKDDRDTISQMLTNAGQFTRNLSRLNLEGTVDNLEQTLGKLNQTLALLNSGQGSMGLLLNDKKLYNNLSATANSLNILLQDLRMHPKRYVNISVFGGGKKAEPLMKPLEDSLSN